jgi:sirohydrochlorin cobaltochelatase
MERGYVIVLVMHGSIPSDFPKAELGEYFDMPRRMREADPAERQAIAARHTELESKLRAWPRTAQNDPYWHGSNDLALGLAARAGVEVLVAFNEFCQPTIGEAIDAACAAGAAKVVVTTVMLTRGGEHAEKEIPEEVQAARERHPGVEIVYAWPFRTTDIARFLADEVEGLLQRGAGG